MQEDCKRCGSVWDGPLCDTCHDVMVAALRALHTEVFLAALSGGAIDRSTDGELRCLLEHASWLAAEAIRQHAAIMAERDAAIEAALEGGDA